MSTPARQTVPGVFADIPRIFALQNAHQWEVKASTAGQRKDKLKKLKAAVEAHADQIMAAVKQDTRSCDADLAIVYCRVDGRAINAPLVDHRPFERGVELLIPLQGQAGGRWPGYVGPRGLR